MENNLPSGSMRVPEVNNFIPESNRRKISFRGKGFSPSIAGLIAEAGANFFSYLKKTGLTREPNLVFLSAKHHYYCDDNELKNARILVNLKRLNLIKHLDMFLFTLIRILPQDANFIGCFSEKKIRKGHYFGFYKPSGFFNGFINFLNDGRDNLRIMDILQYQ